jgi:hypothetical protein
LSDKPQFQGTKRWHKDVKNNPIGERLHAAERSEEAIRRRKEEKSQGQSR